MVKKSSVALLALKPVDMFGSEVKFNIKGEENYKTFFGCFWTLVMVGAMGSAFIYYLIQYFDTSNVTVTNQIVQESTTPTMNLKDKGLFFTLMFSQGKKNLKDKDITKLFDVTAYAFQYTAKEASDGSKSIDDVKPKVKKINIVSCKKAGVNGTVKGKTILGKFDNILTNFGFCPDISDSTIPFELSGDDDSDYFAYIEVKIAPCSGSYPSITSSPTDPNSGGGGSPTGPSGYTVVGAYTNQACLLPNPAGSGTGNLSPIERQYVRQQLRDYSLTLSLIESTVDGNNYDDPLIYKFKSSDKFSITSNEEKTAKFIFKTIVVNTDRGIVTETFDTTETYSPSDRLFDVRDRDGADQIQFHTPDGDVYQPIPYLTLRFLSGNSKQEYTRTYVKILDIMGLVGGVSEVLGIFIGFLYAWYSGIRMEQDMINHTILHIDPEDETVEEWEKNRELKFMDIFKFHYLKCCFKKTDKYKLWHSSEDGVSQKTDIVRIIKSVSDINLMKEAFLNPAQRRIMKFAVLEEKSKEEEEEDVLTDDKKAITGSQAIRHIKKENENEINFLDRRLNTILIQRAPPILKISATASMFAGGKGGLFGGPTNNNNQSNQNSMMLKSEQSEVSEDKKPIIEAFEQNQSSPSLKPASRKGIPIKLGAVAPKKSPTHLPKK